MQIATHIYAQHTNRHDEPCPASGHQIPPDRVQDAGEVDIAVCHRCGSLTQAEERCREFGSLVLQCPCYRLNGDFWYDHSTPGGGAVQYTVSLWDFDWTKDRLGIPNQHVTPALHHYHQTMRDLLSAGF